MPEIKRLIKDLAAASMPADLTNQYADDDPELDRRGGAAIRRNNLETYLRRFLSRPPRLLILAEAAGYRGCRFSGIVFTSEHTLLNDPFFKGGGFERSSRREQPWREASASIVWETLGTLPFPPLMWATVPFHPHKSGEPLSNRAPTQPERQPSHFFSSCGAFFQKRVSLPPAELRRKR
jgi:uracil-DNA glycosylase